MLSQHASKTPLYPYDEWKVRETSFDVESNLRDETIFAIGNGYIGIRGTFEEGCAGPRGSSIPGTYVNGFYDSHRFQYGEPAYGYPEYGQTMLNVTDCRIIELWVAGERFNLTDGTILDYERTLDFKVGKMVRHVVWESPAGRRIRIKSERMACFDRQHTVIFSYEVTPLNFDGEVSLVSALNGDVRNLEAEDDPRVGSHAGRMLLTEEVVAAGSFGAIRQCTRHTGFELVCAMENELRTNCPYASTAKSVGERAEVRFTVGGKTGEPVCLTKIVAYYTSRDKSEVDLMELARQDALQGKDLGFATLAEEQERFLNEYWETSDIQIDGDDALQQGVRFNAFHLLQSVGRDGRTNIASKGLTGEGYSGHYFWDTEIYVFPFFLYTQPDIARKLLEFRCGTLDQARQRARQLAQKGALYPWRTIGGEENSAYYPAGTAQYHINADIAYATMKYLRATQDAGFLASSAAEMLFETARLWADLGDYIPAKGNRFCINNVTGPDEYTAVVNNNFYTNLMAKAHLEDAAQVAGWLKQNLPEEYRRLTEKLLLTEEELAEWERAAEAMYLPYDEALGIIPQDDSFLAKARWDFEHTPRENYPLLLHYHPLVIYRHQVLKQADVVLALYMHGNRFSTAAKKRNFDYYEPITTHDSSLSPCIYGIAAAELGYVDKAYDYFLRTARMDLDDYNGNVKDGIHTAAMAGAWLFIVNGFGGMREYDGALQFQPIIPASWQRYQFRIAFQGRLLEVAVTSDEVTYTLLRGEPLTIQHFKQYVSMVQGQPQSLSTRRKLEAVIFDLDGVITDTAEYHYLAWKQLADELGIPFDRQINERLRGISRVESLDIILANAEMCLEPSQKDALTERKNQYYLQFLEQVTPRDILPGIAVLLSDLKESGIRVALASASRNAPAVLEKLGLTGSLDVVVDAGQIEKGKPDPEIFLTAADMLGVPYRNCAGIEDAEAGIQAIRSAGMFAVGVGTGLRTSAADWVVPDTSGITLVELADRFSKHGTKNALSSSLARGPADNVRH